MNKSFAAALFVVLAGCAAPGRPVASASHTVLQAEVMRTERDFARTMAERNFAGFQSFLAPEAIFFDGKQPLVGANAVAAAWKSLYEGGQAPFSWDAEQVEVLASGDLALSTGSVLNAQGKTIAQFNSIWRRVGPGKWRIVFDKGCGVCPCASR